ncbi:hypothetical protein Daus18300_000605 [Diaporthe australafricana]|uniref:Uncharacterized protein n=1 Tax=Diaporthe australafricana TaxID=127596 RepID=A0ABR3Y524_9PEZI
MDIKFHKSSIDTVDDPHRVAVTRAIANVLSTEIAEITFAQTKDGLPLVEVVDDGWSKLLEPDHPIFKHTELSPGSLDDVREFREGFDVRLLRFDTPLLNAFQAASPGSRAFKTRLIEILAVAIHQMAVLLYENNPDLSPESSSAVHRVHVWEPPKGPDSEWNTWWQFHPHGPPPTLFHHTWYINHDHYPDGAADVAGYWAESRIIGGVVLFDRSGSDPDAVYLHPDRDQVTYRISKLTDEQKVTLVDFLTINRSQDKELEAGYTQDDEGGSFEGKCPLPILSNETNLHRVDPEEPFSVTGVYRDVWEREMPVPEWMGDGRASYYPTKADQGDALLRWMRHGDSD